MEDKIIITETERLILRRYKKEDLQDLFEYLSDEEVVKYEPYKPLTFDETRENLAWRIGTGEMIAVELKHSHKMIGNVYLGKRDFEALEIGYVFNRNYWGHGYAAESCRALIGLAFSNGVHRIYAQCDPDNESSWKLLEALGFWREAHFRKNVYFRRDENEKAIWKDTYVYARLNDNTGKPPKSMPKEQEGGLLESIDRLHTTQMGAERIKRNLQIETDDVVQWCRDRISDRNAKISRTGKNWYILSGNCRITVNAHSYTIITAHRTKGEKSC